MIPSMTETVGREFLSRLHLTAVGFVLPEGPNVEDAVVLAEDLLASGYTGSATVIVASLRRRAIRSDAEQPIRGMLAEYGVGVPVPTDEDSEYQLLLTAFGYWDLPVRSFEGLFYVRIPAWDDQDGLDRTLVTLLDRRDHATSPEARLSVEREMRAVRAHVPAV
jgi:hypothetical protein